MGLIILGFFIGLATFFFITYLWKENQKLQEKVRILESKGPTIKLAKWIEDFFPFMPQFEEPENFKFIGEPIDGIGFNTDKIVFYEFKTGKAQKTEKEKRIKALVEEGKIEWKEIKI